MLDFINPHLALMSAKSPITIETTIAVPDKNAARRITFLLFL